MPPAWWQELQSERPVNVWGMVGAFTGSTTWHMLQVELSRPACVGEYSAGPPARWHEVQSP